MKHEHWSRPLRARLHVLARYLYDARRYLQHSSAVRTPRTVWQRQAHLTKLAHVVEKGLALPNSRLNFGEENIRQACALIAKDPGDRSPANLMALNALRAYIDRHTSSGAEPITIAKQTLDEAHTTGPIVEAPALHRVRRSDIEGMTETAGRFMRSRRSVRQFEPGPIDPEKLIEAVKLAQTAPSVCNRQAGRVHFIVDRPNMDAALKLQGGNRGFGDTLAAVAVVTCELGAFLEPNERNQAYVDGGLFGMAFLLGLHAQGLGACPLNWSRNPITDVKFRHAIPIPASETIIMLVGIGNLREEFVVANSSRIPAEMVYDFLPSDGI